MRLKINLLRDIGLFILFYQAFSLHSFAQESFKLDNTVKKVKIEWQNGRPSGFVSIKDGKLRDIKIVEGKGIVKDSAFEIVSSGNAAITIQVDYERVNYGSCPTLISIETKNNPFTFFLRDVDKKYPIFLPEYSIAVLPGDDKRGYLQVKKAVEARGGITQLERLEKKAEPSFESATRQV